MTSLRHLFIIENRIISMMVKHLLVCLFLISFVASYGQQTIQGTVADGSSTERLPGVNVHVPYTLIGTSTSVDGEFELTIPINSSEVLISSVGYQSKVIKAPFSTSPLKISLAHQTIQLSEVNIESKVDKKWKQQFKRFEKEFIGNSKLARKCKIINPWVVDLKKDDAGIFIATAQEPIVLENKATGYIMRFQLQSFSKKGDVVTISGKPYFKERLSNDRVIKEMQLRSRQTTYYGSKSHFLFSLQMDLLDEEGFEMYLVSQNSNTGEFVTRKELKRNHVYRTGIFSLPGFLKVVYTKEEDEEAGSGVTLPANGGMTGSTVESSAYQTSYLSLLQNEIKLGANGIPANPEQMIEYGYWNRDRMAELLPNEFIPKRLMSLQKQPVNITSNPEQNTVTLNGFKLTNLGIPFAEIKRGGPPKDGIPSIDKPRFDKSSESTLPEDERVLGITFNGISKAYPIKIMNWHEIVNDSFDNHPVVITYCPLCGSGVAFDAFIEGQKTTFGVSGLLYNSDVLLYDRQSESLWSQIEMLGVAGKQSGKSLKYINTSNTTWNAWKQEHPNTLILSEDTGFTRNYDQSPYSSYALSDKLMFPVNKNNPILANKELVTGINIGAEYKAYPHSVLKKEKEGIIDQLGGRTIIIKYDKRGQSVHIEDESGTIIPAVQLYWFAWYAFHPNTSIFK